MQPSIRSGSLVSASPFLKDYSAKYQSFRKQTMRRLKSPLLPSVLMGLLLLWVVFALSQIWIRVQPMLTAKALSQEIQIYQNLLEQKKRLGIELSQKRSQWYPQAQEHLHMIYPTEFIPLPLVEGAAKDRSK